MLCSGLLSQEIIHGAVCALAERAAQGLRREDVGERADISGALDGVDVVELDCFFFGRGCSRTRSFFLCVATQ